MSHNLIQVGNIFVTSETIKSFYTMFTIILYYFIVVMLVAGALINFVLWLGEIREAYNYRREMNRSLKIKTDME